MKLLSRVLIVLLILAALSPALASHAQDSGTFPRTVTDGAGNKVTISAEPMHIVSVTLGTDEILFALVVPSRLAAITANATDPAQSDIVEQAKTIPHKLSSPDPEAIVALKPDLVFVASYTDAGVVKQLQDAKITVFLLGSFSTIKDIESNITLLGQVVGEEAQAAKIVAGMEAKLKTVADAVKGVKPLTVLYYGPDGYSDGAGSTIDDVITHAGGINAVTAGGIKDPYPQLSDEFVVAQAPDVILLSGFNSYAPGFVDKFNKNPNFQTLKAVKNKRVVVANDAHIASVSQYIVEGVSDVAALLYPDAYKPEAAMSATASATATLSETTTP
ncbi:MAG TPA: ABC transporter substrate-binding protein [Aggregatilineaceae bacterium]|nr:ABC transporter substrate-binding protein [Aggregatilineaceae bacterium]